MINDKFKFIRIHIKKTGGRSFWHIINQGDSAHFSWLDYHKDIGPKMQDYFVWSIVRNPWERMVSLFFYETHETGAAHTPDFSRFIEDIYFYEKFKQGPKRLYDARPQTELLKDHTGQLAVDFIGCLSHIQHDFEQLKKRLGFPAGWKYPHHGANKHDDYRKYYNPLTVHYVAELFPEEIALFCFDFEDKNKFKYPVPDLEKQPLQLAWRKRLQLSMVNQTVAQ